MIQKIQSRQKKLIENIAKDFSLEKLSKSQARFSIQKLDWFNRQYIKMMSLEEFAFRALSLKLKNSPDIGYSFEGKPFRVGDYVMFVDLETQKVFADFSPQTAPEGMDGNYYYIGGGREIGQTPLDNLLREIEEEMGDKVTIDSEKIIKITDFKIASEKPFIKDDQTFFGKEMHMYFYALKESELSAFDLHDNGERLFDWRDLSLILETNQHLKYPIWRNFCLENNLPLLAPSAKIKQEYLAWFLDKNRVTVLSEFGSESDCILNWSLPDMETLKWKKISLEESLKNLAEIATFVLETLKKPEFEKAGQELQELIFEDSLSEKFQNLVSKWEAEIKKWLELNSKSTGDYLWPLRVCLSGKIKSPSPFELLTVLTASQIQERVQKTTSNS